MSIQAQINGKLNKIDTKLNILSKKIGKEVRLKLQENLNKAWYDNYTPKVYERTYDLFNSVSVIINKNKICDYEIKVYFDEDKINATQEFSWNKHMGFNGEIFKKGLYYSIEHGMKGSALNPRYGESAHMIEETRNWAISYARQLLKEMI